MPPSTRRDCSTRSTAPAARRRERSPPGSPPRFGQRFWVDGRSGRFPAVALDGAGRPVDSLTSNIGHLPATGILDDDEIAAVAAQIRSPRLDSGHGLRTMADDHPRYNPLGYHTGSVWPHDTAIAIDGLARTGHGDVAGRLAMGLLDASAAFDWRLPELFGGWSSSAGRPVPVSGVVPPAGVGRGRRLRRRCAPHSGCTSTSRRARSPCDPTKDSPRCSHSR